MSKFTKGEVIIHKAPCSFQHWQLRDLLHCSDENPHILYYVHRRSIFKYDTMNKKSSLVQSLDYSPVSMCMCNGFIATGGHDAQISVKDLRKNEVIRSNMNVGGSINNACHISKYKWLSDDPNIRSAPRIFLSNNDNIVKIYSLPSMREVQNVNLHVACNYTATSRDGKYMAAVADNNYVFLYDMRNGYRLISKMQEYFDGGFSCAFDASCTKLAAASQDGSVVLWDIRNTRKPLKKFEANLRQPKAACRSVKFAPTYHVDLMIFSEHDTYIHLVDMRTFERQIINVLDYSPFVSRPNVDTDVYYSRPSLFGMARSTPKDICGIDFSCDSKSIFVALTDHIQEYSIDPLKCRMFACGSVC